MTTQLKDRLFAFPVYPDYGRDPCGYRVGIHIQLPYSSIREFRNMLQEARYETTKEATTLTSPDWSPSIVLTHLQLSGALL